MCRQAFPLQFLSLFSCYKHCGSHLHGPNESVHFYRWRTELSCTETAKKMLGTKVALDWDKGEAGHALLGGM